MSERWFDRWIRKAENDFEAATSLVPERTPDTVAFLCQQCIEKYLKAALVHHGLDPPRTHDLVRSIGSLEQKDERFRDLVGPARYLRAFAVHPRYPGTDVDPDLAGEAVDIMRDLRDDIRALLDLRVNGGTKAQGLVADTESVPGVGWPTGIVIAHGVSVLRQDTVSVGNVAVASGERMQCDAESSTRVIHEAPYPTTDAGPYNWIAHLLSGGRHVHPLLHTVLL